MNERDAREAMNLGAEAARVIDSPAFKEAWERLAGELHQGWLDCSVRDVEKQKLLLQQAKLVDRLRATLERMIEGGKMAEQAVKAAMPPTEDLMDENLLRRGMRAAVGRR